MVFRIFSETLWYPGQKMNHMSLRSAEQGKSRRNRDGSSTPTSGGAVVSQVRSGLEHPRTFHIFLLLGGLATPLCVHKPFAP